MSNIIPDKDQVNLKQRFDLTGRIALVTGSARGIGRAIALGLAEFGARVIVHGVKPTDRLAAALEAVQKFSPTSFTITGDLSDPAQVSGLFEQIAKAGVPTPDILVANASVQFNAKWDEITLEAAQLQMQVNFHATLQMIQTVMPRMKEQKWGRVVTVGSVQEFRPHPLMAVYAASKSAQENLVRNLARQLAADGVTVNNLCPGVFATDRNAVALGNPEYAQKVMQCIPSHTYAEPADAAGGALLLCSDAGRYITGSTLVIDGGLRLPG